MGKIYETIEKGIKSNNEAEKCAALLACAPACILLLENIHDEMRKCKKKK